MDTTSTGFNWQGATFDLLKFGISKKFDAEQRETIIIRDPEVQHEANDAGQVQQVGTTQAGSLAAAPEWAKWGGIAFLGLLGTAVVLKAVK
ncbi:MAG: hypothetical protein ACRBBW_21335 [Cellvibrionaceae bacterium]